MKMLEQFLLYFSLGFFIVWYFVRPILVLILGLLDKKKEDHLSFDHGEGVSVVIPCHNEEETIEETIRSVLNQVMSCAVQIIVVENNSTDRTFDVVQKLAEKFYQIKPYSLTISRFKYDGTRVNPISYALNFGIGKATFPIILRLDADTQLGEPNVLKKMVLPIIQKQAVLCGCNVGSENDKENILTRLQTIEYFLAMEVDRKAQQLLQTLVCASGAMQAFCKEAFLAVGGYEDNIHVSEDMDLTLKMHRIGCVQFINDAVVYTDTPNNAKQLFKQRTWWTYIGMVCAYQHKKGLFNREYGKFGLMGFIGLPLKIYLSFQSFVSLIIRVIASVVSVLSGITVNLTETFITITLIHVLLDAFAILICIPVAKNKQVISNLWLIPIFSLIYGPLLNLVKVYAVFSGIYKVNKERIVKSRQIEKTSSVQRAL